MIEAEPSPRRVLNDSGSLFHERLRLRGDGKEAVGGDLWGKKAFLNCTEAYRLILALRCPLRNSLASQSAKQIEDKNI